MLSSSSFMKKTSKQRLSNLSILNNRHNINHSYRAFSTAEKKNNPTIAQTVAKKTTSFMKRLLKQFIGKYGKKRFSDSYPAIKPIKMSNSRSRAVLYSCVLSTSKGDKYTSFVKISPLYNFIPKKRPDISKFTYDKLVGKDVAFIEMKFYMLFNKLRDDNVCDMFPRCLNETFLQKNRNHIVHDLFLYEGKIESRKMPYFVLFTEPVDAIELEKYLKIYNISSSIIFQIMYALSCFELLGFRHMDLHFGNILIERVKESYDEYEIKTKNGYKKYLIFNEGVKVRLIDLDGSIKLPREDTKIVYKQKILNPEQWSGLGPTDNPRIDLVKILFHLKYLRTLQLKPQIHNLLVEMGITGNTGKIPFLSSGAYIDIPSKRINGKVQTVNENLLNYGYFVSKNSLHMKPNRNVIQFGDDVIKTPMAIIQQAAEYMERTHSKNLKRLKLLQKNKSTNSYSHRGIFERVNFNK